MPRSQSWSSTSDEEREGPGLRPELSKLDTAVERIAHALERPGQPHLAMRSQAQIPGTGGRDNSMNPYLVPGLEARPDGPLCPFHVPDHERYYVPVDNTQEAFEQFQEQMGDLLGLRDEGRLVVVSGQRGCGKTALINRCASWLRDTLGPRAIEGKILPLTQECLDSQSIKRRMNHVFQCVVDDLWRHKRLSKEDHIRGLKEQRDDLGIAYRYLSSVLDDDLVTIVLLPPSEDLVKEVSEYAKYARKNIVFFVESSYVNYMENFWPSIREASRMPPIRLDVGLLGERDGWRFAQARQEHYSDAETFRRVSETTMLRVTEDWKTSIGQLQALLFGVYRELNDESSLAGKVISDEVTYGEITNYYFRLTRNNAGHIP